MKLFPYVLMRITGDSFDRLHGLEITLSYEQMQLLTKINDKLSFLRERLCELLYNDISALKDSKVQNQLLNFKRDIYNGREITNEQIEAFSPFLNENTKCECLEYLKLCLSFFELKNQFIYNFENESKLIKSHFREIVSNDILFEGLLLSSQSLLKRAKDYLGRDINSLTKDNLRTEQSLLKYITRIYAKTSPFSKFTGLGMAKLSNSLFINDSSYLKFVGKAIKVKCSVKLNNFLFSFFLSLLLKHKVVFYNIPVKTNPTIQIVNDTFVFLTNFNNIESFQRIPANDFLWFIYETIGSNPEGIIYSKLINNTILNAQIEATEEEISLYLYKLIEYGFLEFNIGVSGIDSEWDTKLIYKLNTYIEDEICVGKLSDALAKVKEETLKYGDSDINGKETILNNVFLIFKNLSNELYIDTELTEINEKIIIESGDNTTITKNKEETKVANSEFKHSSPTRFNFKPEQMIYEDCFIENDAEINQYSLESIVNSLSFLMHSASLFNGNTLEMEKMKFFFCQKYKKEESVNIFSFYEEYFRGVKKKEKERESIFTKGEDTTIELNETESYFLEHFDEITKTRNNIIENNCRYLSKILQEYNVLDSDSVHIQKVHLKDFYDKNTPLATIHSSNCAYVQFINMNNNHIGAVINNTGVGYGKMYSRFLHLFPDYITENLRECNLEIGKDALLAECTDSSVFNANLHPTLMPFEIKIPGGQNNLPLENQIELKDIQVCFDTVRNKLKLMHKELDKEILIFDLCFQSLYERSNLYQLLSQFTINKNFSYNWIISTINNSIEEIKNNNDRNIRTYPRIVFDDKVVLQRKYWVIRKNSLPYKRNDESQGEYFLRLNLWRKTHNINNEIFMHVNENKLFTDIKLLNKSSKDDYKPQYINFKIPYLVNLFAKNLEKVTDELRIVEMLPGSADLIKINGQKFVSEYVIQWYH
jgi:lantibiotic biosynthesis protein